MKETSRMPSHATERQPAEHMPPRTGEANRAVNIFEIEINGPLPALPTAGEARLLIRDNGRPVAFEPVHIPQGGWYGADLQAVIGRVVDDAGPSSEPAAGSRAVRKLPTVSVVVTTCKAHQGVIRVLDCLRRQSRVPHEVIVVDNRPATSHVRDFLRAEGRDDVRLVQEHRPGVALARNAGLAAARSDIVTFTDDDVILDERWIEAIQDAFVDDQVACVTGLVLPSQLETRSQLLFEEYGGFAKGFRRRIFDLGVHRDPSPLYPYAAGIFGTGANSSFRTDVMRSLGGFDSTLGTGTTRGGEDLDMFLTIITNGHVLIYEPAAIIHHQHHRTMRQLRRQLFNYGAGLSAMLTTRCLRRPSEAVQMLRRAGAGLRYLLSPRSDKNKHKGRQFPLHLTLLELAGFAWGPVTAVWILLRGGIRRT
jgi:GT2 family glycosyltransferase